MEKLKLSYLSVNSARSYNFYMIPKDLLDNPAFDSIDINSKVLYSLMLNRASLSATNSDFIDDNGNVYVIYTVEQVMEAMRCSNKTAIKMLKQLDDIGLIVKKRLGQGKASLLYVMDFSTASTEFSTKNGFGNIKKCKNYTSKHEESSFGEVNFLHSSHIDQTKDQFLSYNDSIDQQNLNPSTPSPDSYDFADKASNLNINLNDPFANLNPKYANRVDEITEIKSILSEVNSSRRTDIRVNKKDVPLYDVKYSLNRLTSRHIEYVLDNLQKKNVKGTEVKRHKPYLLTTLYNAASATLPVDVELVKQTVKQNISLDYLMRRHDDKFEREHLSELYDIIVEVLISTKKSFRLAKSEFYADDVKRVFASLTSEHVEAVLEGIRTNTSEVKAVKAFVQTALWNSFHSLKIGTTLETNNFLYEHFGIEPKTNRG